MAKTAQKRLAGALLLACLLSASPGNPAAGAGRGIDDPLVMLPTEVHGGRGVPTEAEWATDLVEALELDAALPSAADDTERFALLCADRAPIPGDAPRVGARPDLRVRAEADPTDSRSVRLVATTPATALYLFSVEGTGMQRWQLDGRLLGHLDATVLGMAQAPIIVPLRAGPHELAATLAPDARVAAVELIAHRSLCIAPADGWHAERPLRYGVLARTLVHALGLESELPTVGGGIPIEGEDFAEAAGGPEISLRRLRNDPSAGRWARAGEGPIELVYPLELDEPGLFSVLARLPGGGSQIWSVDGRYRSSLRPQGPTNRFGWNTVITLPLGSGRHVLRVVASPGSGVDKIRLVRHEPAGTAYVGVLGRAGFAEGAPEAAVPRRVARQSLARLLQAPGSARFLNLYASGTVRSESEGAVPEMTPPPAAPPPVFRPETWR